MKPPIFIIGCGRTGSKLILQVLNSHPEIGMGSQLHLINPWHRFKHSGLITKLKKIGDLNDDENALKAIDYCMSEDIEGSFWEDARETFDKERMKKLFLISDRTHKYLIKIFLEERMRVSEASIPGSKFPLHFHHLPLLKEWFPDSKIIHLTRDPRAVLASEINKSDKPRYNIPEHISILYGWGLFAYVSMNWLWAVRCHEYYNKKYDDYILIRYEDMVADPLRETERMCDFLDIDYHESMLDVEIRGSSYYPEGEKGFNKRSLTRWKHELSKNKERCLTFLLKDKMKRMGYV